MNELETPSETPVCQWGNAAIRDKALTLLADADAKTGGIVDTGKILKHMRLRYQEFTPTVETSMVLGAIDHNKRRILVNRELSDQDKHYTIAHEIGHAKLHPGESMVDFRITQDTSSTRLPSAHGGPKEREANVFAHELIMPLDDFIASYKLFGGDIVKLSLRYFVTETRVQNRLGFLKKQIASNIIPDFIT